MATITERLESSFVRSHMRAFDVRRDLAAVADLVEICFADTLDPDGERYLQHMRNAARRQGLMGWALAAGDWSSVPLNGYVWEQDGRLVGNLSVIPYSVHGRHYTLVANVAVHPDYRRQGIGRALTLQGIEHGRQRRSHSVWLHVREENLPAVRLYEQLGFLERARRTSWLARSQAGFPAAGPYDIGPLLPSGFTFSPAQPNSWPQQQTWLQRIYPAMLTWHLPFNLNALNPGLRGWLSRLVENVYIRQWEVRRGRELLGVVSWQSSLSHSNSLWLAAPLEPDPEAIQSLLQYARLQLASRRPLSLDYPAHQAEEAIRQAGFTSGQTLMWMEIPLG